MGKRHHSNDKNSDNTYLYKLFALFCLMNTMKNKMLSKNIKSKLLNEEHSEDITVNPDNDPEYLSPDIEPYIQVNLDLLAGIDKNAMTEDFKIPEEENIREDIKADESEEDCSISVISEVLPLCESQSHTDEAASIPLKIKIPVVLTKCTAAVNIESSVRLSDNVSEICHISRHVFINQCMLAPDSEKRNVKASILFIDGYIRENIEYRPAASSDKGSLKYTEINIPFKCAVNVNFKVCPELKWNESGADTENTDPAFNADFFIENSPISCSSEKSFQSSEFFNEQISCRLISTEFDGTFIIENKSNEETPVITEKAVLLLTIELLQKQNIEFNI